jgi:hypothetical protein
MDELEYLKEKVKLLETIIAEKDRVIKLLEEKPTNTGFPWTNPLPTIPWDINPPVYPWAVPYTPQPIWYSVQCGSSTDCGCTIKGKLDK